MINDKDVGSGLDKLFLFILLEFGFFSDLSDGSISFSISISVIIISRLWSFSILSVNVLNFVVFSLIIVSENSFMLLGGLFMKEILRFVFVEIELLWNVV